MTFLHTYCPSVLRIRIVTYLEGLCNIHYPKHDILIGKVIYQIIFPSTQWGVTISSTSHDIMSDITSVFRIVLIESWVKDMIFLSERSSNQWTGESFDPPIDLTIILLAKLLRLLQGCKPFTICHNSVLRSGQRKGVGAKLGFILMVILPGTGLSMFYI